PRLAELPLYVVLLREAEASVGVQARVRRLPRGLRREELRGVRLRPAGLPLLEQPRSLVAHEVCRLDRRVRLRDRELHSLVRTDRAPEDDALRRVASCQLDEPVPIADALGRDQDPLRVHPVEDVAKALSLVADER